MAFAGTAARALGGILAGFGLVWFVFGFSGRWTIPGIANPGLAILVSRAGLGLTVVASIVWFVWQDAMALRARTAGMSAKATAELLDRQPAPIVAIERLSGLMTFGWLMILGLFASSLGWWAYPRLSDRALQELTARPGLAGPLDAHRRRRDVVPPPVRELDLPSRRPDVNERHFLLTVCTVEQLAH